MHLELRHLRAFLAVAEELNFSRAAERLYIAQPALSAQIRALEANLGVELFARTTRKVELTEAGALLVDDAREIIGRVDDAAAKIQAFGREEHGRLRLGFFVHGAGDVGAEIIRRFGEECPAIALDFVSGATLEETQRHVRDRETDVAFVWHPLLYEELVELQVRVERLGIGMRPDHPLAAKEALTVEDVSREPIAAPYELVAWEVLGAWLGRFRPHGRRPDDPHGRNHDECLAIASRGLAVYCAPESVWTFNPRNDLVFRPVVELTAPPISLVWHRDAQNPAVTSFVDVTREVIHGSGVQEQATV